MTNQGFSLVRWADGIITVTHADSTIVATDDLLAAMVDEPLPDGAHPSYDPQAGVLVLDTAGTYRYQYVSPSPDYPQCSVFERITTDDGGVTCARSVARSAERSSTLARLTVTGRGTPTTGHNEQGETNQ